MKNITLSEIQKDGKYRVRVTTNQGRIQVGTFTTIEEAAQAYTKAAKLHHGNFYRER